MERKRAETLYSPIKLHSKEDTHFELSEAELQVEGGEAVFPGELIGIVSESNSLYLVRLQCYMQW